MTLFLLFHPQKNKRGKRFFFYFFNFLEKMNIFRLAGDLSHLFAILLLLAKIWKSKSVVGLSGKTQVCTFFFVKYFLIEIWIFGQNFSLLLILGKILNWSVRYFYKIILQRWIFTSSLDFKNFLGKNGCWSYYLFVWFGLLVTRQ